MKQTGWKIPIAPAQVCAGLVVALLIFHIAMLIAGLHGQTLAPCDFDEGVYWQTLRSMSGGYHLYRQIFYSQPPLFLVSVYPVFVAAGSTLQSARLGIALLTLVGLAGAYLIGRALAGRIGSIAALAMLVVSPIYLVQSQTLQAEGPATAFLFLTVGAALMWRQNPTGLRGYCFACLTAVALSLGILTKLFDVVAVVPIAAILIAHLWETRKKPAANVTADLRPVAVAILVGAVVTVCVLAPFAYCFDQLVRQTVTFHFDARNVFDVEVSDNIRMLDDFLDNNLITSAAVVVGMLVAILRRDWRIVPLAAWLLATLAFLFVHRPLFPHHLIILIAPAIAIITLALNGLSATSLGGSTPWQQKLPVAAGILALAVIVTGLRADYSYFRNLNNQPKREAARGVTALAAALQRATEPGQWIMSDDPFAVAVAGRDTPPWAVDSSRVRIWSGYLPNRQLIALASDVRVHGVLFATERLNAAPVAGFHAWVAAHFHLVPVAGADAGVELWAR